MTKFSINNGGNPRILGLSDPTQNDEAATKKYVDDHSSSSVPRVSTLTASGSTYTINTDITDLAVISSPTTNFTVTTSGTPIDGQKVRLRIINGATAYSPTWDAIFMSSGLVSLPSTPYPSTKTNLHGFIYDANKAKWVLVAFDAVGY